MDEILDKLSIFNPLDPYDSFLASKSTPTGKRWFDWLMTDFSNADAAVLCLTPEVISSDWIPKRPKLESAIAGRPRKAAAKIRSPLGTDVTEAISKALGDSRPVVSGLRCCQQMTDGILRGQKLCYVFDEMSSSSREESADDDC